jgi:hypothetical protein
MQAATVFCSTRTRRPGWVLWLVAIPAGMLINGLTGALDNLPQALMTLLGWLNEPTRLQRLVPALVSNILVPGVLVYFLLRMTALGGWIAPNRLALAVLMLANGMLVFMMVYALYQASIDMPPYLVGLARDLVHPALVGAVAVGLGTLAASTIWHRSLRQREDLLSFAQRWWRECES